MEFTHFIQLSIRTSKKKKKKKNNRQAHTLRDKTMKVFVMGLMAGTI